MAADLLGSLMARAEAEVPYRDLVCQSDRASDYYGLGVRLGVYFAWLGSYIANTILPSEFGPAADTSTIFLLVLLIAMATDATSGELTRLDGLVLMHLCGGTVFGVVSLWGYRTRLYRNYGPKAVRMFGGFGTHIRMTISFAVSAFGFWFWIYGVNSYLKPLGPDDGNDPPNDPRCTPLYTFFFAKLEATGGIRYYYIVVCSFCMLYFAVMFLVSGMAGIASFTRFKRVREFNDWAAVNRTKYATGFSHRELKYMFNFLRVGNLLWLLFSATTVEVTLNFNKVGDVLGGRHGNGGLQLPGQLLPFLTGLLSFIRVMYALFKEKVGDSSQGQKKSSRKRNVLDSSEDSDKEEEEIVEATVIVSPTGSVFPPMVSPSGSAPFSQTPRSVSFPPDVEAQQQQQGLEKQGQGGGVAEVQEGEKSPMFPPPHKSHSYHIVARSLPVRYMVGLFPWLGLVVHPTNKRSRLSTIVSTGTGLSGISRSNTENAIV